MKFIYGRVKEASNFFKKYMVTVRSAKLSGMKGALRTLFTHIFLHMFLYLAGDFKLVQVYCEISPMLKNKTIILHRWVWVSSLELNVVAKTVCQLHAWHKLTLYKSKCSPICLPHWWIWQSKAELKASQSFHSGLMEQWSWDVVTIGFYLHGALRIVEINTDRYRWIFLTIFSLPAEN